MSEPVRLALFTDSLRPSGVGQVMLTLARFLPREKYFLFLVCSSDEGVDGFVEKMRPHVADVARLAVREEAEELNDLEPLVRQLRAWKIDLFHNHVGATWEGGYGTLVARCAGIPVVVATEHLPNVLRISHELEHRRAMNRLLDSLITVSESVRWSLIAGGLAPAEKIVTIENGVEPRRVREPRSLARRELQIPEERPVVLFLGRLVEQKDPATLLQATRRLLNRGLPVTTLFAGDGWLRGEMEALTAQLQLRDQVRFLGNRADVDRLLGAADVLALPSHFEGLPLAALEAMSAGLPVVGCDAPGVRDAVEHGVNGWLAPICDAEELARGLQLSLATDTGRDWARAARRRYAQKFTAEHMAWRHHELYMSARRVARGAPCTVRDGASRSSRARDPAQRAPERGEPSRAGAARLAQPADAV